VTPTGWWAPSPDRDGPDLPDGGDGPDDDGDALPEEVARALPAEMSGPRLF
jgi:hypothetical protein